jgi:hypothetical protein
LLLVPPRGGRDGEKGVSAHAGREIAKSTDGQTRPYFLQLRFHAQLPVCPTISRSKAHIRVLCAARSRALRRKCRDACEFTLTRGGVSWLHPSPSVRLRGRADGLPNAWGCFVPSLQRVLCRRARLRPRATGAVRGWLGVRVRPTLESLLRCNATLRWSAFVLPRAVLSHFEKLARSYQWPGWWS